MPTCENCSCAAGMKIHEVMRLKEPCRVAMVGAGGKTSALWRLSDSFEGKVVLTTSTHLSADQVVRADRNIYIDSILDLQTINWTELPRVTSITGPLVDGNRLHGLTLNECDQIFESSRQHQFSVIVEADGARMLPLKAPAEHEPAIPPGVDVVIVVAGLTGLGQLLDERAVFRVEEFSTLSGIALGQSITAEGMAKVLCDPRGGLKGIPEEVRRVLLLNQLDSVDEKSVPLRIANSCIKQFDMVIIGSVGYYQEQPVIAARIEPVAGIILAAGGSKRFGGITKALLEFEGETLIRRAVKTAKMAGLDPVIVVTGYHAVDVEKALNGLDVEIIPNNEWESGQSSSIRAGLRHLGGRCGAALFLLTDQPFVTPELIDKLVQEYQTAMTPIIAPLVDGMRANPVLFDRVIFNDLMTLEGDTGGRGIMSRYQHAWLPWLDQRLLMDIDTPDDLEMCKNAARSY